MPVALSTDRQICLRIGVCPQVVVRCAFAWLVACISSKDMSTFNSALTVPDSLLAKDATAILREHATDLLFNHSVRVYLFAAEQGVNRSSGLTPNFCTSPRLFTIAA